MRLDELPFYAYLRTTYAQFATETWHKSIEKFQRERTWEGIEIPSYCYLPSPVSIDVLNSLKLPQISPVVYDYTNYLERGNTVASYSGVASVWEGWNRTKGVYTFDKDLFSALTSTPLKGEVPVDMFHRLPEWVICIQFPEDCGGSHDFWGMFVWINSTRALIQSKEAREVYDVESELKVWFIPKGRDVFTIPTYLPLVPGKSIEELRDVVEAAWAHLMAGPSHVRNMSKQQLESGMDRLRANRKLWEEYYPYMNLVLYLCAENREVEDAKGQGRQTVPPGHPRLSSHGRKTWSRDKIVQWDVGYRIGAVLRFHKEQQEKPMEPVTRDDGTTYTPKRPHSRIFHWHTYWRGKRESEERHRILKFLPVTFVNCDTDTELPIVERRVKEDKP